tara:strand:- start:205 stop:423 length:219 start_codon:yes stop_codon:yes gene_type:complete
MTNHFDHIGRLLKEGSNSELSLFIETSNISWYDAIKIANNIWETEELKRLYKNSTIQKGGGYLAPYIPERKQ